MDKYSTDSVYHISPATIQEEKQAILQREKRAAFEKVASFNGRYQDPYPSPFLNLSDTEIPKTTIEIFQWCKYFFMFDPLISGAINALAAFPITEVYLEDKTKEDEEDSDMLKTYKRVLFKDINIYKLLIEIGIDYFLFGNCFVFGEMAQNEDTGEYEWKRVTRLDPSKMIIDYNPATGNKVYKWQIPVKVHEIVKKKEPREEYEKIPDIIKQAVLKNESIVLNSNNVFHLSRATDSMGDNSVWGTPIVANVLKLLMYRNTLRQSQEAIAREHIVPMRIYYLDKTDTYNLEGDWNNVAQSFANELNKAVRDPNHKIVSPVPVNLINVGGEGRSLLLAPEIQQVQDEILAGMNVPREFIFGGVSYSGSSVSLKILENQFITYRLLLKDFIQNFLIKNMAKARNEWVSSKDDNSLITVKLQDLKMQDDVQQKQLIINLNSAGKCTNDYMWKTLGIDSVKMRESLEREAIYAEELKAKLSEMQIDTEIKLNEKKMLLQKLQLKSQMELQQFQQQLAMQMQPQQEEQMQPQSQEEQQEEQMQSQEEQGQQGEQPHEEQSQQEEQSQEEQDQQDTQSQEEQTQEQEPNNQQGAQNIGTTEEQKIAIQLLKLPKSYQVKVLESLSKSSREKVIAIMNELMSSGNASKNIDMRPMPEQRPPRRNSLK